MAQMSRYVLMWMGIAAVSLGAGCNAHDARSDFFVAEDQIRLVDRFAEVQAAEGAREDAMLYPTHFDETELNAAGETKLDLMIRHHPAGQQLVVYVNLPKDDKLVEGRHAAVDSYLRETDPTLSFALESGHNPKMRAPAAAGLSRLERTDAETAFEGQATISSGAIRR